MNDRSPSEVGGGARRRHPPEDWPEDHFFALDPARAYPVLDRADHVYVWDTEGNRYLDAVAGLGVVNIGYGRTEVADAMAAQAARMPFNAGNIFSNEPAIRLAAVIAEMAPGDLNWVHFTSGGSEAVEVALKMARQYHVERGQPERDRIIGRWTSYHGATLGGLSVGGAVGRRAKYLPMLLDMPHIPPIYCYRCPFGLTYPTCQVTCADELEREILRVGPEKVAAFIAEPVVASVGGAIQPQAEYFPKIREICDRYGVLLIVDEVITGFGRTGRNFGIEHYGVVPDLMIMGKGISSGYSPLAAVAVRDHVHQAFVDAHAAFEHIFTFGGNPVSAAAGLAVLDIFRREHLAENAAEHADAFAAALEPLREFWFVGDIRTIGYMGGIEFVANHATKEPFPASRHVALMVRDASLRNGLVTYPGTGMAGGGAGDIISLYPPLTAGKPELDEMSELLLATFRDVAATLGG
ncbi:MAG TPA: aspartate aminotransferase family protein [Candidatus Saccharimonadales bacterium]|nr:aspartate aminotransferase family protein [Candidatus Saccharimonadales bacterium]